MIVLKQFAGTYIPTTMKAALMELKPFLIHNRLLKSHGLLALKCVKDGKDLIDRFVSNANGN
jgi:hypothetical protein